MLTENLTSIADIQCGLVLSRKEAQSPATAEKIYNRLNLRSLRADGCLDMRDLDIYPSEEYLDEQILTHHGDIIIRLFAPLSPVLINDNEAGFVIPSQLAVLRIKDDVPIVPGYLRWYLSSSVVARKLRLSEPSVIQRAVKISELSSLDVPIPPIKKQHLMVQIFEKSTLRQKLYEELLEQESIYINDTLEKVIGGTEE